jgi:nucleoside-diphosphate-sugar epimerase
MTEDTRKTALVIGATGGVGGAVTRSLLTHGWHVRALKRTPQGDLGADLGQVRWVKGDAMNAEDVVTAATEADLIVHAANPPGYRNWDTLAPAMLEGVIAGAKASGATILFPGNVYNYGPDLYQKPGGAVIQETSPQNPITRKGRIRVEMERRLEACGAKTIIVRAGDFFGPGANSWFAQLVKPAKPVRGVVYPGDRDAGHAWAYLPDLAEAMVRVVERRAELPTFATFNFGGHWFDRGVEVAEAVLRSANKPQGRIGTFPWPMARVLSPVAPLFREVLEMRYLWTYPLKLDNSRLVDFLGEEPHTPVDTAVATALRSLGCLPGEPPWAAAA